MRHRETHTLSPFVKAYWEAALWSTNDESTPAGGEPMDKNYSLSDVHPAAIAKSVRECAEFQGQNKEDLTLMDELHGRSEWTSEEQAGHDFWLTRNGHGCGFWDRGLGDVGDRLTQACKKFGEVSLQVHRGQVIDDGMQHWRTTYYHPRKGDPWHGRPMKLDLYRPDNHTGWDILFTDADESVVVPYRHRNRVIQEEGRP